MKKLITILLSLIMVFSLFACDSDSDSGLQTYTGTLFGGDFVLVVNGNSVTATQKASMNEDGFKVSMEMSFIGGKATTDGNTVSADFSGNVTYELTIKISGEGSEEYIASAKEEFLANAASDSDKQLIEDLFNGKTVKFGRDSILVMIAEGFTFIKATVNGSSLTFNEIRYDDGSKYLYEYHKNGALKSEKYYNEDGNLVYSDDYEDEGSGDSMGGDYNGGEGGENNQQTPADTDNSTNATTDKKDPTSDKDNNDDSSANTDNKDEYVTYPDGENNSGNTVMGGGSGNIIIGGGSFGGDTDENGGINLSDGVLFYVSGTFVGKYSGMDAVLTLPATKMPTFTIKAEIKEGDTTIKQTILVKGGELIYSNSVLVIVNFDVPDIKYYMSIELEGSGASAYKKQLLSDLEGSGMSASDIQLYKDALDGKEITFGKESEIYKGVRLPAIKFALNSHDLSFEAERFDLDQNQGNTSNSTNSSTNSGAMDSLTNIGGSSNVDVNQNNNNDTTDNDTDFHVDNFGNETPEI